MCLGSTAGFSTAHPERERACTEREKWTPNIYLEELWQLSCSGLLSSTVQEGERISKLQRKIEARKL
jgi:hypothetical protein